MDSNSQPGAARLLRIIGEAGGWRKGSSWELRRMLIDLKNSNKMRMRCRDIKEVLVRGRREGGRD